MKPIYEKMTNQKLGAHLESKIKTALTSLKKESNHGLAFHRFYDTKSAGAYLPEQPADFLVGAPMGAFYLEAKASFKKQSLASCLSSAVSGGQAANSKLWCRSGPNQQSLFLFFCAETEVVELWDGLLVAETYIAQGRRLSREDVMALGKLSDMKMLLKLSFF